MRSYEFGVSGNGFPREHGYHLLAALSKPFPFLHGRNDLQILGIRGTRRHNKDTVIFLDRSSKLQIRGISPEEADAMVGTELAVDGYPIKIGSYREYRIKPSSLLVSSRVIFDMTDKKISHSSFGAVLTSLLPAGVKWDLNEDTTALHIVKPGSDKGKTDFHLEGYTVRLADVPADFSVTLQEKGLGAHRSMGCGIFYPGSPAVWARIFA